MVPVPWVTQPFQALCFLTVRVIYTHSNLVWWKFSQASFRQAEHHLLLLQPPALQVRPSQWRGWRGSHHQSIIHGPNHPLGQEAEGWRQSQMVQGSPLILALYPILCILCPAFSPARFSWVFTIRTGCVKAKTLESSLQVTPLPRHCSGFRVQIYPYFSYIFY